MIQAMRAPRPSRAGTPRFPLLAVLSLLLAAPLGHAELIYDNSANDLRAFLTRTEEFGDEVIFAGSARTVTAMSFQVFGEPALPPNAKVVFRLYRNGGPPRPGSQAPTPSELLYQSEQIDVRRGVQVIRILDLQVNVPSTVTWSVAFVGTGTQAGTRAGLQIYHPPVIGRSFRDYWVREPDGWRLYAQAGSSFSFAATFEALPDPEVRITTSAAAGGRTLLTLTGPIGSEQVVEASADTIHWRTVGLVSLATNSTGTLLAPPDASAAGYTYRARPSPNPGNTVLLQSIQRGPSGSTTVTFAGPPGSEHFLEVSGDQRRWTPVDILRFSSTNATYIDTAAAPGARFYRTSRPYGDDPIYFIRGIRIRQDGATVITFVGTPSTTPLQVEGSAEFQVWTRLGSLQFTNPVVEFVDTQAPPQGRRFYRLRQ